jgi:predicted phage terminase large subunit-like protein
LTTRYKPEIFFVEEENIARSIGPILKTEQIRRNIFIPMETLVPTQDKVKRAQSIRFRMRAGGVEFLKDAHWYADFMMELITFPRGRYMDQVDAFALIGLGLAKMSPAYTTSEVAAWEYEEEFEDSWDHLVDSGRSSITGY